ncbi:hypothetical protein CAOG_07943 [Capsaspora owczarzaki ATCC 30864]|uniref:Uncharacterized protein n=1 Tax=Capsaspora owczarzaki (strain ATCC 30864) TaxID=595528 RepID=A0A0D2USB5_CAPO3|nr:hypothetical protein CAOG_07943 [Capsaspora owczarzaki ATCC 30864]KJE97861.1 hypothetical protein CAOG_007943 [Capsaspora owczarzaki ATCC 30864]|eukprot:XP_004343031.1 hypothetical protein CAOG_07943 [Capsaspora owczarzaki ATCC 30864]
MGMDPEQMEPLAEPDWDEFKKGAQLEKYLKTVEGGMMLVAQKNIPKFWMDLHVNQLIDAIRGLKNLKEDERLKLSLGVLITTPGRIKAMNPQPVQVLNYLNYLFSTVGSLGFAAKDLSILTGTIAKLKAASEEDRDYFINQQVVEVWTNWMESEETKNSPRPYFFVLYAKLQTAILNALK